MITINARGARTLKDAKPLVFRGQGVYVSTDGDQSALHMGGKIVARRNANEVRTTGQAQVWAYETAEAKGWSFTDREEAPVKLDLTDEVKALPGTWKVLAVRRTDLTDVDSSYVAAEIAMARLTRREIKTGTHSRTGRMIVKVYGAMGHRAFTYMHQG